MKKGSVVLFKHKAGNKAGIAEDLEGKSTWKISDERGMIYKIAERDIVFELPGFGPGIHDLSSFLGKAQARQDEFDGATTWEVLDGAKTTTLADLAELAFSDADPITLWAVRAAVEADRIHFKDKGEVIEVRSAEQVRELSQAAAAESARLKSWGAFSARWKVYQEASTSQPLALGEHPPRDHFDPDDIARFQALESFALFAEESTKKNVASKVLEALDRPVTPENAFKALVEAGWWHRHVHLGLLRRGMHPEFSQDLLDEAAALVESASTVDDDGRLDLRHQKVYTIDSESTQEIDDGLALERDKDGQEWIWIHIADPSRLVVPGTALDNEAKRRASTCYVATGPLPMLPFSLSAGIASLNPGQATAVLSFATRLDLEGNIAEYRILPSTIVPVARLTYEEADAIIETGEVDGQETQALKRLHELACLREAWRGQAGAIAFGGREIDVKVDAQGEIILEEIKRSTSRTLVSELMILAGEVAGTYGMENNLALPYRTQSEPSFDEDALATLPEGPVRDFARRRSMPKSRTSTSPLPHSSLGLKAYVQVTSPLRRYNDLASHRVLKASLRGEESPLSQEDWDALLALTLPGSSDAAAAERESDKYWLLEYLARHAGSTFKALILGCTGGEDLQATILFPDLGLEWNWKPGRTCSPGEKILLRIKAADPRNERLVLQEVD